MSALISIFNFLYVYSRVLFCYLVGGTVYSRSFANEQYDIFKSICIALGFPSENSVYIIEFPGEPILLLILSIFVVGSIIGLIHRIMR